MADILIRMEMPKTCGLCQLCLDDSRICNGYCMFFHRRVNMMERDKDCPIVPLPEGHGKLIDIEDVKSGKFHIEGRAEMYSAYNIGWNDALDAVCMNVPSIVPSEGGGEE